MSGNDQTRGAAPGGSGDGAHKPITTVIWDRGRGRGAASAPAPRSAAPVADPPAVALAAATIAAGGRLVSPGAAGGAAGAAGPAGAPAASAASSAGAASAAAGHAARPSGASASASAAATSGLRADADPFQPERSRIKSREFEAARGFDSEDDKMYMPKPKPKPKPEEKK